MAKIDWHIVPVLSVVYFFAFLDRYVTEVVVVPKYCPRSWYSWNSVNIGNAVLFGLQKDLDITTGTKYNTALTIFFIPYVFFEVTRVGRT